MFTETVFNPREIPRNQIALKSDELDRKNLKELLMERGKNWGKGKSCLIRKMCFPSLQQNWEKHDALSGKWRKIENFPLLSSEEANSDECFSSEKKYLKFYFRTATNWRKKMRTDWRHKFEPELNRKKLFKDIWKYLLKVYISKSVKQGKFETNKNNGDYLVW